MSIEASPPPTSGGSILLQERGEPTVSAPTASTYLIVTNTRPSKAMEYILWRLVEQTGIRREDCALLSFLGDDKPEGSYQRIPLAQFSRALPAFRSALESHPSRIILPMGNAAFKAVTGLAWDTGKVSGYAMGWSDCIKIPMRQQVQIGLYVGANKKRGIKPGDPRYGMRIVACDPVVPPGCEWIVPCIPIETVVKMRYKNVALLRSAFTNASRLALGERPIDFTYDTVAPGPGGDWDGYVSYDLEVPINSTAIERASLSSPYGTWTFPWDKDAVRVFKEAMSNGGIKVAHNQQFDIPILAAHGIEVPEPTFDTMLAAALLEPDSPKGLLSVAPRHLLLRPWKHIAETAGFADPFYSAKDAFVERELALVLEAELQDQGMTDLFHERIMPSVPVLMDMKQKGIKVDQAFAGAWCAELDRKLQASLESWFKLYPDVKPTSTHQLKKLFYDTWNLPVLRRKGDGIRTDEFAIRTLSKIEPRHAPALMLLLEIRETGKMLSSFGKSALGVDRVHPSYLPVGKDAGEGQYGKGLAATGRLACSNPNIQQQPKEARRLYIPDTPEDCFIEFDWDQAELRVAAALSGDRAMMEALRTNIHTFVAQRLGCDKKVGKAITYGSAYGAGPPKLKEVLEESGFEITVEECRAFQTQLARTFPVWWAWRSAIGLKAAEQQHLRNPFGRLRWFLTGQEDIPAALDFLPQSCVGDMAWSSYRPLWDYARSLDGRLVTVVHDSFLLQVPASAVATALVGVRGILERPFDEIAPGFTCPVTVKVGQPGASWGDLTEWKA